jgi:Tfp pilus assembly protein PilP
MRLAKSGGNLFALLVMLLCLPPGLWAQQPASPKSPKPAAKPAPAVKAALPAKAAPAPAPPAAPAATPEQTADAPIVNKRDPFAALINNKKEEGAMRLPPGKAGLVIATVKVDGTVRSGQGMIAVVSNPANSVYFIREGDRLYDGDVEKIGLDGVTFREDSKDAFGHPIERTVTKRIYASAGEQQ